MSGRIIDGYGFITPDPDSGGSGFGNLDYPVSEQQDERPAVVFHRVTPESIAEFLAWQAEGCTVEEFTFSGDPGELFEGSDSTVTLKGFWGPPA